MTKEEEHVFVTKYDWPEVMYDIDEMFTRGYGSTMVDLVHQKILALKTAF